MARPNTLTLLIHREERGYWVRIPARVELHKEPFATYGQAVDWATHWAAQRGYRIELHTKYLARDAKVTD